MFKVLLQSMGSQWANKCEIKRDLFIAQGKVLVDVLNAIYPKAKPLNQNDIEGKRQNEIFTIQSTTAKKNQFSCV